MIRSYGFGIDRYRDPRIPNLRGAADDARDLAEILAARVPPAELAARVWVDDEVTHARVRRVLGREMPREASPSDVVLIHFAGHAEIHDRRGRVTYGLVVHDTAYWDAATRIDASSEILRWMSRATARLTLLILDTCAAGWIGPRARFWPSGAGNLDAASGAGRLIITATRGARGVREDDTTGRGVFGRCLLAALDRGLARHSSLFEIFEETARVVEAETNGEQVPTIAGFGVGAARLLP